MSTQSFQSLSQSLQEQNHDKVESANLAVVAS